MWNVFCKLQFTLQYLISPENTPKNHGGSKDKKSMHSQFNLPDSVKTKRSSLDGTTITI